MCGRYTLNMTFGNIVDLYRLTMHEEPPIDRSRKPFGLPNYNVAPTLVMPIVRPAGNGREMLTAGGV